ncbi:hypothetical protein HPB52_024991 [Rhipicephalus sanguineus]|uniref:Uncharacterized protein n=1 Tax=Rhipicephalus sanguineus TaxID=34632 RepID=A0A9D4TDP6_RHISA|nr:hypothetical protein HPB52_024991 [Rhipicephalus sanguineus]
MFTQVRSFSQLKYDLRDVNTFVLEPDDDDPLVRTRSFHGVRGLEDGEETNDASSAKVLSRSESAPSLEGSFGSGEENERTEDESAKEGSLAERGDERADTPFPELHGGMDEVNGDEWEASAEDSAMVADHTPRR